MVMKEDVETLEDVVVTGYMNIRNSSFTGNAGNSEEGGFVESFENECY